MTHLFNLNNNLNKVLPFIDIIKFFYKTKVKYLDMMNSPYKLKGIDMAEIHYFLR